MDTGETFIKMRLAAIPDMGRGTFPTHPPSSSYSFIHERFNGLQVYSDTTGNFYVAIIKKGKFRDGCQLERLDQLQAMVGDSLDDLVVQLWDAFAEWDGDGSVFSTPYWALKLTSMEQLWLAFVMKENHGKEWTSEEWTAEIPLKVS